MLHQGRVTRGQGRKCHKGKKCHMVKVMYDQGVKYHQCKKARLGRKNY